MGGMSTSLPVKQKWGTGWAGFEGQADDATLDSEEVGASESELSSMQSSMGRSGAGKSSSPIKKYQLQSEEV